jgi:hypothetical protein
MCSQSHCADRTIWVIDDVFPSDVFSAHPVETESRRYRTLHSSSGKGPWHGDVFKTIFAIHDFFPTLSYRTITDGGNPQTVIVRRPRKDFSPRFGNLETISRMTYFDFLKHQDLLNPSTEADTIGWLKE